MSGAFRGGVARLALAVALFCCAVSLAVAQTGGLEVLVTDGEGPLPGAIVTLSNDQGRTGTIARAADGDGVVFFPVLMSGSGYAVDVSFPGKATRRLDGIVVRSREVRRLEVRLLEQMTETVKVTGVADVVDLDRQEQSSRFSDDFIRDLPVAGRFYQNILTLAPGVQDANNDGNPNVHGSRSRDFKAMVNGVSNVDPFTGQRMADVNPNAIEELELITAGAGPEYGRAQGGFANILLKQGGNRFEGVFDFIYRTSDLDGDGAFNRDRERTPSFDWTQPSLQLSGPIVKDRLWYRLSHEWIDREDPTESFEGLAVATTRRRIDSDQLTWQVSERNKLAFRHDSNPLEIDNFGLSTLRAASAATFRRFDSETYSLAWDAPYSPQLYVSSLVAFQDSGLEIRPVTDAVANDCVVGDAFLELAQCFDSDAGLTSGSFWLHHSDDRERFTVKSDATYYLGRRFLGMSHELKFGLVIENEKYAQRETRATDIFKIVDDPFRNSAAITVNISVPASDEVRASGTAWGFYLRDTMKPVQNVTIDLGARFERETISSIGVSPLDPLTELTAFESLLAEGVNITDARVETFSTYEDYQIFVTQLAAVLGVPPQLAGSFFGPLTGQARFQQQSRTLENIHLRNDNVSPYFAVSWDPWSDGKTKIAVSAGRHYNNIPLNVPAVELQAPRVSLGLRAFKVQGRFVAPDIRDAAGTLNPATTVRTVRHDLRTPYQDEFTATLERELWNESSVALVYIRREYRDQLQDIDRNHRPGDFGTCVRPTRPGEPSIIPVPDGVLDDCIGEIEVFPGGSPLDPAGSFGVPDGFPDIYVMNPFWGAVYEIGNYNSADYESFVLQFVRRQFRGWEMQGSYTWSMARGNGEDFQQEFGNDPVNVEQEFGFQSTDQRHVVKIGATTVTPWNFRLGGVVTWQSGLPYSVLEQNTSRDAIPPSLSTFGVNEPRVRVLYPTGVRNDRRNASVWNFDLKAAKDLAIGRTVNLQLSFEAFNLLNRGTYRVYNESVETGRQINGRNEFSRDFGRRYQIGLRLSY